MTKKLDCIPETTVKGIKCKQGTLRKKDGPYELHTTLLMGR